MVPSMRRAVAGQGGGEPSGHWACDRLVTPKQSNRIASSLLTLADHRLSGTAYSQQHRQRVGDDLHIGVLAVTEPVGDIRIDVDLAEDVIAAPNQDDELRLGVEIARQVVADGADVGNVLILPRGDGGAAHSDAHGDPRVLGLASCKRLELQLVAVQHVGIDRGVGPAPPLDPLTRHAQQIHARRVVEMRGAQRPYRSGRIALRARRHERLPSTAVSRSTVVSRFTTMRTVSPARCARTASVMSYRLP